MRVVRILSALIFPTSGQFAAGRYRRGAAWAVALLAAFLLAPSIGGIPVLLMLFASVADAAVIAPRPAERTAGQQFLAILVAACVYIVLNVAVKSLWVQAFKIPAGSMIPTLEVGDHLFIDKRARTPGRGDVIVFKYPKNTEIDFIKRVIAVAGDTLEMAEDGSLVLNGKPVPRKHVDGPCEYQDYLEETGRWDTRQCDAWDETLDGHTYRVYLDGAPGGRRHKSFTVSDGYFVLGDNRDNSHDSRFWGSVPAENVRGTARIVWWSYGPDGMRWSRINQRVR